MESLQVNTTQREIFDSEKAVFIEKTGETIAVPWDWSEDQVKNTVDNDILNIISEIRPGFYEESIAPKLKEGKVDYNNIPFAAEAFGQNLAQAITFRAYSPSPDEQRMFQEIAPVASTAGQFTGFIGPMLATGAMNQVIGRGLIMGGASLGAKFPAVASLITRGAAVEGAVAEALPMAGKIAGAGTATGAQMFEIGIAGKAFDAVHAGEPIDWGKIAAESGKEALPWVAVGSIGAAVSRPFIGLTGLEATGQAAKEMAISGGSMYVIAKSEGATDNDATLQAFMAMAFHSVHIAKSEIQRQTAIEATNLIMKQYIMEKNGVINESLASDIANAITQETAQQVVDESRIAKDENGKPIEVNMENVSRETSTQVLDINKEKTQGPSKEEWATEYKKNIADLVINIGKHPRDVGLKTTLFRTKVRLETQDIKDEFVLKALDEFSTKFWNEYFSGKDTKARAEDILKAAEQFSSMVREKAKSEVADPVKEVIADPEKTKEFVKKMAEQTIVKPKKEMVQKETTLTYDGMFPEDVRKDVNQAMRGSKTWGEAVDKLNEKGYGITKDGAKYDNEPLVPGHFNMLGNRALEARGLAEKPKQEVPSGEKVQGQGKAEVKLAEAGPGATKLEIRLRQQAKDEGNRALKPEEVKAIQRSRKIAERRRIPEEQPKWTEQEKQDFDMIERLSADWEAGGKLVAGDATKDPNRKIRSKSTFPPELSEIGLTHRDMKVVFDAIKSGKPLSGGAIERARILHDWYKEINPLNEEIYRGKEKYTKSEIDETQGIVDKETPKVERDISEGTGEDVWLEAPKESAAQGGSGIDAFEKRSVEEARQEGFRLFKEVGDLLHQFVGKFGEGWQGKKNRGIYELKSENIYVESLNRIGTAVHEAVHFIDDKFGIVKGQMKVVGTTKAGHPKYDQGNRKTRKDLTDVYVKFYPGAKADHPLKKRMIEGLAVFFQKYLEQPTMIKEAYPQLYADFIDPSGKYYDKNLNDLVQKASVIVGKYQALDPMGKTLARMNMSKRETESEFLSFHDRMINETMDDVRSMEVFDKLSGADDTKSVELAVRQNRNVARTIAKNVKADKGFWVIKGGEIKKVNEANYKTLADALEKNGTAEFFDGYLMARDTYFNYMRLDDLKQKAAMAKEEIQSIREEIEAGEMDMDTMTGDGQTVRQRIKELREAGEKADALEQQLSNEEYSREDATATYKEWKEVFVAESKLFDELNRATLDMLHEVGLVTNAGYEEMIQREGYATRMRELYNEILGDEAIKGTGIKGGNSRPNSLKGRTGGNQVITSIFFSTIKNHASSMRKAYRQVVFNNIADAVMKAPKGHPLWEFFKVEPVMREKNQKTGVWQVSQKQLNDNGIIMGRIGGKYQPLRVNGELKNLINEFITPQNMTIFEKLVTGASSLFTKGTTGWYIPFALKNFMIDQISAVAQTQNNYKPVYDGVTRISKALLDHSSKEAKYLEEYLAIGGEHQTLANMLDLPPDEFLKHITKEATGLDKAVEWLGEGFNVLALPVNTSEMMTRGAEYIRARMAGKTQGRALEDAGRVTAPFHHIGRMKASGWAKTYLRSIPYAKAKMQIAGQFIDRATNNKDSMKRMAIVAAAIGASSIGGLAAIIANGTEEQKRMYKNLPSYVLANNIVIPNPTDKTKLIKIAVPGEFQAIVGLINMGIAEAFLNPKYRVEEYLDVATNWIPDQVNVSNPVRMTMSWLPQFLRPGIESAAGVSTFPQVRPIETQADLALPPEFRSHETTSELAKAVGMATADNLHISPLKFDHLVSGYFGRTTRFLTDPGDVKWNPFEINAYLFATRQLQQYYKDRKWAEQQLKAEKDELKTLSEADSEKAERIKSASKTIDALMKDYKALDPTEENKVEMNELRDQILDEIDNM